METTKKRKRDIDLPRIVYDATTRVFDRLFKEDSLEGMKDVVRKKLGVPASTPVQLAQLRDGQTVDLEDDDDFEAFSSSAYKSSTAKVKVIIGSGIASVETNGVPPPQPQTPSKSSDKKKKAENKKKQDVLNLSQDQRRAVTPQTTPSESPPPLKKRRVSFVEPSRELNKEINKVAAQWNRLASLNNSEGTPEQELTPQPEETVDSGLSVKENRKERKKERKKERLQKAAEAKTSKEGTPIVEGITPQPDTEKEKKKRKKKKKTRDEAREDESTVTPEPQPVESADKPAKKKLGKVNGVNDAVTDDAASAKNSKKRSRTTEVDFVDKLESGKATTPNSSTEPPAETENTEEDGRSTKKKKLAHKEAVNVNADSANKTTAAKETSPVESAPKTPKKSKINSPAIIPSEDPEPEPRIPLEKPFAETDTPVLTKKAKRKSDAQPLPLTPAELSPVEKPDDSASQSNDTPPVMPEAVPSTEKAAAKPKSKKSSDAASTQTEAKTPKKAPKKKTSSSEPIEDTREVTRAAVQAILARKGVPVATLAPTPTEPVTTPAPATTPTPAIDPALSTTKTLSIPAASSVQTPAVQTLTDPGLLQISSDESISVAVPSASKTKPTHVIVPSAASQSTISKAAHVPISTTQILEQVKNTTTNGSTKPSAAAKKPAKATTPSKCPVCDEEPWHVRSKCPIIKSGIRAMRKRISELELELSSSEEDGDNENDNEGISATIAELRTIIEKRTKKPRASEAKQAPAPAQTEEGALAAAPAVKSVDASPPSTEVNVVSSSAAPPPLPDAEAEHISALAVPSKPRLSITQFRASVDHIPSSTQPTPSIQPLYTVQPLSVTQPSHTTLTPASQQLPLLSYKEPKKSRPSATTAMPLPAIDMPTLPSLGDIALATTASLLGFVGDVSAISDHDLEELMRGPKLTSQDMPSEDDDDIELDEDEREPDVVLEEDVVDVPVPKHASRVEYPSSSDEGGEDEEENISDDVAVPVTPATEDADEAIQVQQMTGAAAPQPTSIKGQKEEEEEEEEEENEEEEEEEEKEAVEEAGQKSFQEMNLSSSSRSSGKAADAAVNDAVSADLALPSSTPAAPSISASVQDIVMTATDETAKDLDTVIAAANPETSSSPPLQAPPVDDDHAPDPIEVDDEERPPTSPPEAILSADDADEPPPKESTPKMALRTRSQRTKASAAPAQMSASQPAPAAHTRTRSKDIAAASQPEPATTPATVRMTRSNQLKLKKISELAVPVPPVSIRVIRASTTPAQSQTPASVPMPLPTPRTVRQRAAVADETPAAGTATKGRKAAATPAKAPAAAKPPSKAVAKQAATSKVPSKTAATRVAANIRTRASRLAADLESAEEEEEEDKEQESAAPAVPEVSLASWAVLPESQSGPSQNESDLQGTVDVDELNSSPDVAASQQMTAQEDPLFMHTESQPDLPYSQYPLPTSTKSRSRSASPNDSDDDDADEVAAAVVRPRQSVGSTFRSLTEITSQQRTFVPRYSSQLAMPSSQVVEPLDMFGRGEGNGDDEESEESESESEGETPPVGKLRAAHFPQTRLAGVINPSRRK